MGSYQTVQVVAFTNSPIATDYVVLSPGYTFSNGSVAVAGGPGPGSSGTSFTGTSAISLQVGSSTTFDLSATGVAAGSYNSVTVDTRGRVTAAQMVAASSGTSFTRTSNLSFQVGASNVTIDLSATGVTPASSYNSLTIDAFGRVTAAQVVAGSSSGTSFTGTSAISLQVGSTTTFDLSATGVVAGSYVTVSVDDRGRVTGGSTSLSTVQVTGIWTSGVSSTNAQGLGSTWTVSRISSANSILGNDIWASGFSSSALTVSTVSFARQLGFGLVPDGSALIPSEAYSSESSLGMYRSGNSTVRQSYGTFWADALWATSGVSALGSTGTFGGLFVNSTASVANLNVTSTISCSGLTVSSIATTSRLSVAVLSKASEQWTSGISVGGSAGGGSLIRAISSLSTTIPAWVVQGSATSFRTITWADVRNGDIIMATPLGNAAASSISSGIIFGLSHATIAGRFEFRLSNNSTLVQNQSARTWYFVRITPF